MNAQMAVAPGHGEETPGRMRFAVLCGVCATALLAPCYAFCGEEAPALTLVAVTTPAGASDAARIASSLVAPGRFGGYEIVPIRRLSGSERSAEQQQAVAQARALTEQAQEAALAFNLVLAAQLRRRAADLLLDTEALAGDPVLVANFLLEAAAASVEAAEQDLARLYFRQALAVQGDIRPGPLISPLAQTAFEAAAALGPALFKSPSDRTLRNLCASLKAQGLIWIAVGRDEEGIVVSEKILLLRRDSSKLDVRHLPFSQPDRIAAWTASERERLRADIALSVLEAADRRPAIAEKPWYKKWWVYAAAGGVLAAGAVGIALAFSAQPEHVDMVVHH